tara:strand:- start:51 stop:524 length:474 start_codon:yes stop_codon:yes gene_type:complete
LAKPLYNVKFTSNFRFSKLSANFDEVIGDSNQEITDSIARNTKKNILTASTKPLSNDTLEIRRRGLSTFSDHSPSPTTETRPLLYSKRLFNSIKPTKDGLEIMDYGLVHQQGFITNEGRNVPAREFIATIGDDKDALIKVEKRIVDRMNKTMMKRSQ